MYYIITLSNLALNCETENWKYLQSIEKSTLVGSRRSNDPAILAFCGTARDCGLIEKIWETEESSSKVFSLKVSFQKWSSIEKIISF